MQSTERGRSPTKKAVCDQVIKDSIIMHALKEAKLNLHRAISATFPNFYTFDFVTSALLQRQFLFFAFLNSRWYTLTMENWYCS